MTICTEAEALATLRMVAAIEGGAVVVLYPAQRVWAWNRAARVHVVGLSILVSDPNGGIDRQTWFYDRGTGELTRDAWGNRVGPLYTWRGLGDAIRIGDYREP